MKSKERQRLKQNEVAIWLNASREYVESHGRQIGMAIVAVVLLVAAVIGVTALRQQGNVAAERRLAEAMVALNAPVLPVDASSTQPGEVPAAAQMGAQGSFTTEEAKLRVAVPRLQAVVDEYPNTDAALVARYHLAGAQAMLGQYDQAIASFDAVTQQAGRNSLYGRMAAMGRAETQMKAGQLDAAIASWRELADSTDAELPKDAILMELARAYLEQGNEAEAERAFTQLVDEHPLSPYSAEARGELELIRS